MTKSSFRVALFTGSLALSACSGDVPKDKPKAAMAEQTASAKAPPALPEQVEEKALTAAAPARPASVVDAPAPSPTVAPELVDQFEFSHEEPEAEDPAPDRPLRADEVKVDRFVLATGVEGREPVGESDVFDTDTKQIFAFVQLENETAPYAFEVHFEKVDGPRSLYGVKLKVPTAERYRTWAWTKIRRSPGQYRAVLRTPEGEEIGSREFTIEAAAEK
ncbi:MAG: hypothetical protein JWN48_4375 [Myxococcaceae bacterium]|nr:hypothetical protein [Myxococcaceae bacterium]